MVKLILALFLILAVSSRYIKKTNLQSRISEPLELKDINDLPGSLFWGNVSGTNYLTVSRNQHIPEYCGACWAFATTSALSDRFKILRKAAWPDVNLSPQVLLSCDLADDGCNGGDIITAYEYIYNKGITDETCEVYRARGHTNGQNCGSFEPCYTCDPDGTCYVPDTYLLYNLTGFEKVSGVSQMVNALQYGPIACGIDSNDAFHAYAGGIINDTSGNNDLNHAISLVGYGEENGTQY